MFLIYPDESNNIPQGKVAIAMNDNGFVGTNTGWPLAGQPALFPESQGLAIANVWMFAHFLGEEKVRELMPNPEEMDTKAWDWVFKTGTKDHTS